ncbi:MAG: glycosyltransferase, partial [Verrucomicrobiota bacterium]
ASRSETFGNVLTEALASGLAVAGFHYAAARQFIENGRSGLLAPLDEPKRFIADAVRLASEDALRLHLRSNARAAVSSLCWEKVVAGLEAEFMRVAGMQADRAKVL